MDLLDFKEDLKHLLFLVHIKLRQIDGLDGVVFDETPKDLVHIGLLLLIFLFLLSLLQKIKNLLECFLNFRLHFKFLVIFNVGWFVCHIN